MVDQLVQLSHAYNVTKDVPRKTSSFTHDVLRKTSAFLKELHSPLETVQPVEVKVCFTPFVVSELLEEEDAKLEYIGLVGRDQVVESQKMCSILDRSRNLNFPLPSLSLENQSYRQEVDCDYIEVGLCEG